MNIEAPKISNFQKVRGDIKYNITKNECHIPISHGKNTKKYIKATHEHKQTSLHRVIFFENNGFFPKVVMHKCDNPKCINPKHLKAGTLQENVQDMVNKNRHAYGIRNGGGVKLNDSKAKEIKELLKGSDLSLQKIADKFGVSKRTILFIKQNEHWKHV